MVLSEKIVGIALNADVVWYVRWKGVGWVSWRVRWWWNTTWYWWFQAWKRRVNSGGCLAVLGVVKRGQRPYYKKGCIGLGLGMG